MIAPLPIAHSTGTNDIKTVVKTGMPRTKFGPALRALSLLIIRCCYANDLGESFNKPGHGLKAFSNIKVKVFCGNVLRLAAPTLP